MKIEKPATEASAAESAFSRCDLSAVLATLVLIIGVVLPALANSKLRSQQAICVNNLRLVGQGFHLFSAEYEQIDPWRYHHLSGYFNPIVNNVFYNFSLLSNGVSNPKVFACPSDALVNPANHYGIGPGGLLHPFNRNTSVSYFLGLDSSVLVPDSVLSGDRHIRPNMGMGGGCSSGITPVATLIPGASTPSTWGTALHGLVGNILRRDGRVEWTSNESLNSLFLLHGSDGGATHLQLPRPPIDQPSQNPMKTPLFGYLVAVLSLTSVAANLNLVLPSSESSRTAGGHSFPVTVSGDGRYVFLLSNANNLVTNDSLNSRMDLFRHEVVTGITTLVSVDGSGSGGGSDDSSTPAVSRDGKWVTFESAASNLVPGDTNSYCDVFLRDMTAGITRLISGAGAVGANAMSRHPQISADGRFVVFESRASNLVEADTNGVSDIYRYDVQDQFLERVSVAPTYGESPAVNDGAAHSPSMSADGRMIAFVKESTNSTSASRLREFNGEIFSWDSLTEVTHWVSAGVSSATTNVQGCDCFSPVVSGNGEYIVFSSPYGASAVALYRQRSIPQPGFPAELIAVDAVKNNSVTVSGDGRFVAYSALDGIRVWDGQNSSNRLVLSHLGGPASRICSAPAVAADGSRVAFLVASNGFTSVYLHEYSTGTATLVAMKPDGTQIPVADASAPLLSEDGNVLAFNSDQSDIVDGDRNKASDTFVVNLNTSALHLASARAIELPSTTTAVSSQVTRNSISANGRYAAIMTRDLGVSDTNRFPDLYVRDLQSGELTFLGHSNYSTLFPTFSADGRYVAYLSADYRRDPIWAGTDGSTAAVYRVDLLTKEQRLIQADVMWDKWKSEIAISPDGHRVAFSSRNRVVQFLGAGSDPNVYVVDIRSDTTNVVSVRQSPPWGAGQSQEWGISGEEPKFSPDGRWILFRAYDGQVWLRDIELEVTILVGKARPQYSGTAPTYAFSGNSSYVGFLEFHDDSGINRIKLFNLSDKTSSTIREVPFNAGNNAGNISLSGDARWICYEVGFSIYVYDRVLQTNELINTRFGFAETATGKSRNSQISHDGRYVVFDSDAANLVPGDTNGYRDIFIRDRWRNVTLLASVNRTGTGSGNGASLSPVLAADGRTLLFQSFASDLIEGDFNETADVFVLRLGGVDSDGDGMDDDWEVVYFGNLTREGSADFDGDGSADVREFQLGTDPTNVGSVFQVMKLTREGGRGARVLWNANPGRAYRVEFKDDFSSTDWSVAPETVTAAGTTATWTDGAAEPTPHRFYRVVLVP